MHLHAWPLYFLIQLINLLVDVLWSLCVRIPYMGVFVPQCIYEVMGQFCGLSSLLLPCLGLWKLNSGYQACPASTFIHWAISPAPTKALKKTHSGSHYVVLVDHGTLYVSQASLEVTEIHLHLPWIHWDSKAELPYPASAAVFTWIICQGKKSQEESPWGLILAFH